MSVIATDPLSLLAERYDPTPHEYLDRPVEWVQNNGGFLYSTQREIAESMVNNRRTAVPSCFDSGKSFLASALAAEWIDTHPVGSAFVVTTAPTDAQVKTILWRELSERHEQWELPGRITMDAQWKIGNRQVAFGRKPSDHSIATFQGIHDEFVLVLMDEGAGIPPSLYEQAEGLITNEGSRICVFGNPADPTSHFAKICKPGSGWNVIKISAFDTPNFTGEDIPGYLKPLLISPMWVEEAEKRWGKKSFLYITKVLGEFPPMGKDTLIEPGWILKAQIRDMEPDKHDAAFGVDVARFGDDMTMVYLRQGGHIRQVHKASKDSTSATAGNVKILVDAHPTRPQANVDDDGIGGGVTDQLNDDERGYHVLPIKNGGTPTNPMRFGNRRSEMYWHLREALAGDSGTGDDGIIDIDPSDDDLAAQLGDIKYKVDGRGRIWVETKEEMKARGLSSPDSADAVCYSWVRAAAFIPTPDDRSGSSKSIMDGILEEKW